MKPMKAWRKTLLKVYAPVGIAVWVWAVDLSGSSALADQSSPRVASGETPEAPVKDLSASAQEVLRLAESGVEEEVILAYIQDAPIPFGLEAEDIIYLNDLGISSEIVTAMLHRDAVLREQVVQPGTTSRFISPGTNAPPTTPQAVYVTNAPPQVVYFYDTLAPYGTWITLEGYGWGWQPRAGVGPVYYLLGTDDFQQWTRLQSFGPYSQNRTISWPLLNSTEHQVFRLEIYFP